MVVAFLVVASCGEAGQGTPSESYLGTWGLTSGRGPQGQVALVDGYPITLTITDREVGGTSACNHYGGPVRIDGTSFHIVDGLAMTQIGCDGDVAESEETYLAALSAADAIRREGDELILTGPNVELRFELLPPPPVARLVDTVWHLETLFDEAGPDGVAWSAAPATLVLNGDGTLSGTTGCRDLHGTWVEQGNQILFTRFGAEGECSADLQDQDGHVVTVLGDGFTAEVDGQTLTVTAKGGLGLRYRAEE